MSPQPNNQPASTTAESAPVALTATTVNQVSESALAPSSCAAGQLDIARAGAPGEYPENAFPSILARLADDLELRYQAPKCLSAMSAIAAASGAAGNCFVVQGAYKNERTHLNLFVMPVAGPGSGKTTITDIICAPLLDRSGELAEAHRKNTALKRVLIGPYKQRIHRLEQELATATETEIAELLARLLEGRKELNDAEALVNRRVALASREIAMKALARRLQDDGKCFFSINPQADRAIQELLAGVSPGANPSLSDLLRATYRGQCISLPQISADFELLQHRLGLLWMVSPDVAGKLIETQNSSARALLARTIMFNADVERGMDNRQFDLPLCLASWHALIHKILERRLTDPTPAVIRCSPEARELFADFHDQSIHLSREPLADCADLLVFWRENAIKIAGVFALVEGINEMSVELASNAVKVMRWAAGSFLAMRQAGRQERMRTQFTRLEQLLRANQNELPVGMLANHHGLRRSLLNEIAATFPCQVEIETRRHGAAGRPSDVVRLVLPHAMPVENGQSSLNLLHLP